MGSGLASLPVLGPLETLHPFLRCRVWGVLSALCPHQHANQDPQGETAVLEIEYLQPAIYPSSIFSRLPVRMRVGLVISYNHISGVVCHQDNVTAVTPSRLSRSADNK